MRSRGVRLERSHRASLGPTLFGQRNQAARQDTDEDAGEREPNMAFRFHRFVLLVAQSRMDEKARMDSPVLPRSQAAACAARTYAQPGVPWQIDPTNDGIF